MRYLGLIACVYIVSSGLNGCGYTDRFSRRQSEGEGHNHKNPSSVHMLGDSIFRHYRGVQTRLEQHLGRAVMNHATNGHRLSDIKQQYLKIRSQEIDMIIMDGIGNDILGGRERCADDLTSSCREVIDQALVQLKELFGYMAADGVGLVYYTSYFYPEPARWTADTYRYAYRGQYVEAVDYAALGAEQICTEAILSCRFVEIRTITAERRPYTDDGIHPTWNSIDSIVEKIGAVMAIDRSL